MSAHPTRIDWEAPPSPLPEGNRVLESIARQEALRALLAFSELHEQIRNRRAASGSAADGDLFETERFILDEVLQLICDRAQAISGADGIVIALSDETTVGQPDAQGMDRTFPEVVCRATAGPLAIERGIRLIGDSEFLRNCLDSGRILRCDDCDTDARVELDLARQMTARSTVLVPLRGRSQRVGVLQAFSMRTRAFTDQDIRGLDLFAELVLAALKPVDQDRRIHWLSDIAGQVLRPKPPVAAAAVEEAAALAPLEVTAVETGLAPAPAPSTVSAVLPIPPAAAPDLVALSQPVAIPADTVELPEPEAAAEPLDVEETDVDETYESAVAELVLSPARHQPLPFLHPLSLGGSSRPGLSVVMGLVALAALFSAGAWWGMQAQGKTASARIEAASIGSAKPAIAPLAVTAPAPPADVLPPGVADNLMNPAQASADAASLTAVAESKLAALPKITGVRHWSSSVGSTVVIDMEDQVPYEVHRLMSPERIYFDLHDTVLPADLDGKSMDVGDASLTRVRVAQPVAGMTRVVLDTKDGSNFSVSMESNPYRLVIELRGSNKTFAANQFAAKGTTAKFEPAAASAAPGSLKAAPEAALATPTESQPLPARTGKFRIVLDAGHGGWDLGTVGRQGLLEKDLVLDVTQRLGKLLQSRLGAEVMFTRSDDTYLPLDQRADVANRSQADLFVSVHANYSSSAASRGVETYYTNRFSAPASREVERHDEGASAQITPVSLSAGGLHEKIEESRRLAASVQHFLYATLAANSSDIRNRGTKDASFAVLTGTTMPAILTEISFVSSPADERNLLSEAYRQQIAEALYKGIARYQETAPRSRVAQLQKPAVR